MRSIVLLSILAIGCGSPAAPTAKDVLKGLKPARRPEHVVALKKISMMSKRLTAEIAKPTFQPALISAMCKDLQASIAHIPAPLSDEEFTDIQLTDSLNDTLKTLSDYVSLAPDNPSQEFWSNLKLLSDKITTIVSPFAAY